jgi:hypothetical protein
MDFAAILEHLLPNDPWSAGDTYESIRVHSDTNVPTLSECEKAWKNIKHDVALRPIRSERNNLLAASDWTQSADAPVNAKEWAKYRQELRDLPETITDPTQPVTWPSPPK